MIHYLSLLAFVLLVALAAGRGWMLRRRGINAFLFGATDKSDFLLMPAVALFLYSILASAFGLPLPAVLKTPFFIERAVSWLGLAVCAISLVWFALTLRSFGTSFRVGIDEHSADKLVTNGMFALSRNPIYVGFLAFFIGMLLIYPNVVMCVVFALLLAAIYRQILREEKFLRQHYGAEYVEYCRRVRRYL